MYITFTCSKCCDDINLEPCVFRIPKDPRHTVKEMQVGLTTCPIEGCDYINGVWVKNGEINEAGWVRKK